MSKRPHAVSFVPPESTAPPPEMAAPVAPPEVAASDDATPARAYQPLAVVIERPTLCPNQGCKSADRKILRSEKTATPVMIEKIIYRSGVNRYVTCLKCGRRYIVRAAEVAKTGP